MAYNVSIQLLNNLSKRIVGELEQQRDMETDERRKVRRVIIHLPEPLLHLRQFHQIHSALLLVMPDHRPADDGTNILSSSAEVVSFTKLHNNLFNVHTFFQGFH